MSTTMTESNPITDTLIVPIPVTNTERLAQLKQQYPGYYKSWRNMVSAYGVIAITPEWAGGLFGLMKFIEDTATLPNNPSINEFSKLKRTDEYKPFRLSNVYWYTPKVARKKLAVLESIQDDVIASRKERDAMYAAMYSQLPAPVQAAQSTQLHSLHTLSSEQQEQKLTELMELQLAGTILTLEQETELEILSKLVIGETVQTTVHTPKCENI